MERLNNLPVEARIAAARSEILKEGKYPRAVRASDLDRSGLVTYED